MTRLTPEQLSSRKRRNAWLAAALVAFMAAMFLTTFLRMQHNSRLAREAFTAQSAPVATPPAR